MFLKNPEDIKKLDTTKSDLYPILSALNIGIMITDAEGKITFHWLIILVPEESIKTFYKE